MKRNDFIIIFSSIIFVGLVFFIVRYMNSGSEAAELAVFSEGKQVAKLSLYEDTTLEIKSENGGTNTIEIKSRKARIIHSNCPKQVCVNTADIEKSGETIVCLPHSFYIEILGKKESEIDAVAK